MPVPAMSKGPAALRCQRSTSSLPSWQAASHEARPLVSKHRSATSAYSGARVRSSQSPQHVFAIIALQQWPGAVARQALQLPGDIHLQVDHEATRAHAFAIAGVEYRAAPGGDQLAFAGEQFGQCGALAGTETGLALALEDRPDRRPGAQLDIAVGIDEGQAEAFGQALADRRLAGAHGADQDEIRCGIHGPDASSAPALPSA